MHLSPQILRLLSRLGVLAAVPNLGHGRNRAAAMILHGRPFLTSFLL